MSIKSFATSPTHKFQLRDAQDELMFKDGDRDQPCMVEVYGPGSRTYVEADNKRTKAIIARSAKKGGKIDIGSSDDQIAERAGFLADITKGFENVDYEGKSGHDLAVAVYSDIELGFIADQVDEKRKDWANFKKGSVTS